MPGPALLKRVPGQQDSDQQTAGAAASLLQLAHMSTTTYTSNILTTQQLAQHLQQQRHTTPINTPTRNHSNIATQILTTPTPYPSTHTHTPSSSPSPVLERKGKKGGRGKKRTCGEVSVLSGPARKGSFSSDEGDRKKKAYIPSYVQEGELCVVCGDSSTGTHYRAMTCEGCKGFFRRTVQNKGNLKYECKKNGNCEITPLTRNSCQACRYQKCIDAKMDVESVLDEQERKHLRSLINSNRMEREKKNKTLLSSEEAAMLKRLGEAYKNRNVREFYTFVELGKAASVKRASFKDGESSSSRVVENGLRINGIGTRTGADRRQHQDPHAPQNGSYPIVNGCHGFEPVNPSDGEDSEEHLSPGLDHVMSFIQNIPGINRIPIGDVGRLCHFHILDILGIQLSEIFDRASNELVFNNLRFHQDDLKTYPWMERIFFFAKKYSEFVKPSGIVLACLSAIRFFNTDGIEGLEREDIIKDTTETLVLSLLKFMTQEQTPKVHRLLSGLRDFEDIREHDIDIFRKMAMFDRCPKYVPKLNSSTPSPAPSTTPSFTFSTSCVSPGTEDEPSPNSPNASMNESESYVVQYMVKPTLQLATSSHAHELDQNHSFTRNGTTMGEFTQKYEPVFESALAREHGPTRERSLPTHRSHPLEESRLGRLVLEEDRKFRREEEQGLNMAMVLNRAHQQRERSLERMYPSGAQGHHHREVVNLENRPREPQPVVSGVGQSSQVLDPKVTVEQLLITNAMLKEQLRYMQSKQEAQLSQMNRREEVSSEPIRNPNGSSYHYRPHPRQHPYSPPVQSHSPPPHNPSHYQLPRSPHIAHHHREPPSPIPIHRRARDPSPPPPLPPPPPPQPPKQYYLQQLLSSPPEQAPSHRLPFHGATDLSLESLYRNTAPSINPALQNNHELSLSNYSERSRSLIEQLNRPVNTHEPYSLMTQRLSESAPRLGYSTSQLASTSRLPSPERTNRCPPLLTNQSFMDLRHTHVSSISHTSHTISSVASRQDIQDIRLMNTYRSRSPLSSPEFKRQRQDSNPNIHAGSNASSPEKDIRGFRPVAVLTNHISDHGSDGSDHSCQGNGHGVQDRQYQSVHESSLSSPSSAISCQATSPSNDQLKHETPLPSSSKKSDTTPVNGSKSFVPLKRYWLTMHEKEKVGGSSNSNH